MTAFCSVEIRAARMYEDPTPAEFCENEVEVEGDVCGFHDYPDDDERDYDYEAELQREELRTWE